MPIILSLDTNMSAAEITDENYQDFIEKNTIAVIEFWQSNCSYCETLAQHIQHQAEECAGKYAFGKYKVNGKWRHVVSTYEVEGIPSILVYENGTLIDQTCGYNNCMRALRRLILRA